MTITIIFKNSQIIELNNLIKEYCGEEFNIFFMQGLFVSHLSSANDTDICEFMHGDEPILEMQDSFDIKSNFADLLYGGLYNETAIDIKISFQLLI